MKHSRKAALMIFSLMTALSAFAASNQATGTTTIRASKAESMTISASSLSTFDLSSLSPQTLTITSGWNLTPQRAAVNVCVYMDPTNGVMHGSDPANTDVISESYVQAKVGAGAFANINASANCGVAAATLVKTWTLANQADRKNASHSDSVSIQLNNVPSTIQADTYTGALTVIAYTQ
ncbi:MAG: hypothetical protein AB7O65_12745 [Candidatus Korobacteraceae bacterium]